MVTLGISTRKQRAALIGCTAAAAVPFAATLTPSQPEQVSHPLPLQEQLAAQTPYQALIEFF
jgi:hypothetical protein